MVASLYVSLWNHFAWLSHIVIHRQSLLIATSDGELTVTVLSLLNINLETLCVGVRLLQHNCYSAQHFPGSCSGINWYIMEFIDGLVTRDYIRNFITIGNNTAFFIYCGPCLYISVASYLLLCLLLWWWWHISHETVQSHSGLQNL